MQNSSATFGSRIIICYRLKQNMISEHFLIELSKYLQFDNGSNNVGNFINGILSKNINAI